MSTPELAQSPENVVNNRDKAIEQLRPEMLDKVKEMLIKFDKKDTDLYPTFTPQ
jgi:hypothetical protein